MRFTLKDIERLQAQGKIQAYSVKPVKKEAKRAKYNNEKVTYDGMVFDSKKEYKRYRLLLILQKKGIISRLQCQVKYSLMVEGELVAIYIADFTYIVTETGETVVEDVKSEMTRKLRPYRMKKKLMKAIYGIIIKEV